MLLRLPQLMGSYSLIFRCQQTMASTAGFESLTSLISTSSNSQQVLDHYRANKDLYKNEHLIQSVRLLGRFSKTLYQDFQQEDYKTAYQQLSRQVEEQISELSDFELIDILFWMRKAKASKLPTFSWESTNKIIDRIKQQVEAKVYNFRNLVNIYFDIAMMGKQVDFLVDPIRQVIIAEPKQLTPFIVVQMLQGASKRSKQVSARELIMIDQLLRYLPNLLDELDMDQKSSVLKYVAQIEMHYHVPSYRVPSVIYDIRQTLMTNVEGLSEFAVLNIVQAYQHLPGYFPNDLIEEIKNMISSTIQHGRDNMQTQFLLDYIDYITSVPRRRLDETNLNLLLNEIEARLREGKVPPMTLTIDKISRVHIQNLTILDCLPSTPVHTIVESTVQDVSVSKRFNLIPFYGLDFLVQQNRDIRPLLALIDTHQILKTTVNQRFRLLSIISKVNDPQFKQLSDTLVSSIEERADKFPEQVIISLDSINLQTQEFRGLLKVLATKLKNVITPESLNRYYKSIYLTIVDRESSLFWQEWLNGQNLNFRQSTRFIEDFDIDPSLYNQDNINFFLSLLTKYAPEIQFSRALTVFINNPKLTQEIARNESYLRRLFDAIRINKESRPNDLRLGDVLSLCLRMENNINRQDLVRNLLKRCYELSKGQQDSRDRLQDAPYISYMIKLGCLSEQDALDLAKKAKHIHDKQLRAKVLSLAQQATTLPDAMGSEEPNAELDTAVRDTIAEIGARLTTDAKSVTSAPTLLSFRPSTIKPHDAALLTLLKSPTTKVSDRLLQQFVQAIPRKWFQDRTEREILNPIINQLVTLFTKIDVNNSFPEILGIVEAFVNLGVNNVAILNVFLEVLGINFNKLSSENRLRTLRVFGKARVQQNEIFEATLQKMVEQPKFYKGHLSDVATSVFRVGAHDDRIGQLYRKLVESYPDISISDLVNSLSVLINCKADKEFLSALVAKQKISEGHKTINSGYLAGLTVLVEQYFRRAVSVEAADKLKSLLSPEEYTKQYKRLLLETSPQFSTAEKLFSEVLQVMKVAFQAKGTVDGVVLVPFHHYPSRKIIINLLKHHELNIDGSEGGDALIRRRIYESLPGQYKVIQVQQWALKNENTGIDKINYLIGQGIATQVADGKYDLKSINEPTNERKQFAPRQQNKERRRKEVKESDGEHDEEQKEPI